VCNPNLHVCGTFVCANTCRSPHTEYTLLNRLSQQCKQLLMCLVKCGQDFSILFHVRSYLHISCRNTGNRDTLFSVALVTAFIKNLQVVFGYVLSCFDHNPQQSSALAHPSNMSSGPENVTTFKIMIYQFMNRINGCVCEYEKPNTGIIEEGLLLHF